MDDVICPDCKQPIATHAAYRDGRCPVVRWEVLPLPPDVAEMSDEERTEYHAHIEAGTVPVRLMTRAEIEKQYGPSVRISNLRSDDSGC